MSSRQEFEHYLGSFRHRLKQLVLVRGLTAVSIVALLITVAAVALAIRQGFPAEVVVTARVLLFGSIATIVYWLIVLPGRAVEENGADVIETRAPAFDGRVTTWVDMQRENNPIVELLAEDSLKVARDNTPESRIPQKEFAQGLSVAGVALFALLFLGVAGPGNYGYGVRHLWFGWAFSDLLPPQSIAVSPGDGGIRLGGTVNVRAEMQGFEPGDAYVHARFGDGDWQQVEMADLDAGFEFTFFSVREPLEYYVSSANVRSETFEINVVDLPVVQNDAVTYALALVQISEPTRHIWL